MIREGNNEHGIALILVLLALLVLSGLAAAIILSTQTEIWTNYNYRLATQSRYVAEAGQEEVMYWMEVGYTPPSNFASYDLTKYPVQCIAAACPSVGQPVVLSGISGVSSNYPDSSVQASFNYAFNDASLSASGVQGAYSASATLLRMTAGSGVSWLGAAGGGVVQTWQITTEGSAGGVRSSTVQIVSTFERTGSPIFKYGVASDSAVCGAVTFSNGKMDAWNSASGNYATTQTNTGATIGTNGNVTLSGGSTSVGGTIYDSSNITVGNCPDGITNNVGGTPWGGLSELSTTLTYPVPAAPSPMTPTTNLNVNSNTCWAGIPPGCTAYTTSPYPAACGGAKCVYITPGSYGNITSNSSVHLTAGTYNINSLNLNGGSVTLDSVPVIINLGGNGISSGGTLLASQSSTTINDGGTPANLQIVTACCLSGGVQMANPPVITMNASSALYAVVYAPNSYVHITGSSQFLGAVVSQKTTCDSSGGYSYDEALQSSLLEVGPYKMVGFSWSKY